MSRLWSLNKQTILFGYECQKSIICLQLIEEKKNVFRLSHRCRWSSDDRNRNADMNNIICSSIEVIYENE